MSFAASYQQEANEAWLNDLLHGIIDSDHRPESRSVSRQTRNSNTPSNAGDQIQRPGAVSRQSHVSGSSRRSFSPFSWRSQSSRGRHGRSRSQNEARTSLRSPYDESPQLIRRDTSTPAPSVAGSDMRSVISPIRSPTSRFDQQRALASPTSPVTIPERTASRLSDTRTVVSHGGIQTHNLKAIMESPHMSSAESLSAIGSIDDDKVAFAPHPAVRPLASREILGHAAPPSEDEGEHQYPGPFALTLIIIGICLSVFIISVDRNIVTTAIPKITQTFGSYVDVGWYGSAYFLTASACQPLYGRVYMRFNIRWTFLAALAVFEAGSLIGALSPSSDVLILGRAIQGLGSAGILTGSFVVGTHSVRMQKRPVLFACVGILYGVGALCGPLVGGVLTQLVSWRWIFWINLPIGAVTFVSVFFFFKPPKSDAAEKSPPWIARILELDLIGNVILLGACVQLFIALELSQTRGNWDNAPCIGLITGFGVTVLVFIAWIIYKGDKALIPPRIIRQRTVAASCGAAFFIYGALLLQAFYLPIWFQAIKDTDAITSGVNMIPYMLTNALFSLLAGVFVSQNGLFAPPAILGCAIGTVGSGLLATLQPDSSLGHWFGFEVLISAGLGMAIQQGFSAVQTALPLGEVPIGTAAVVAAQSLGGAVFVSVGNTVLQDHLLSKTNQQAVPGVDLRAIFELGATMFREYVPADQIPEVVKLYNDSLQGVFISAVPLCGCAFLCSLCMEWRSVKKADVAQAKARAQAAETESGVMGNEKETMS